MLANPSCTSEPPGELFKTLMPGTHPKLKKSERLGMEGQVLAFVFSFPQVPLCASRRGEQGDRAVAHNHEPASETLGGPEKHRVSHSVGLGWGLKTCIPNKLPGDADSAGTTLWEPLM